VHHSAKTGAFLPPACPSFATKVWLPAEKMGTVAENTRSLTTQRVTFAENTHSLINNQGFLVEQGGKIF